MPINGCGEFHQGIHSSQLHPSSCSRLTFSSSGNVGLPIGSLPDLPRIWARSLPCASALGIYLESPRLYTELQPLLLATPLQPRFTMVQKGKQACCPLPSPLSLSSSTPLLCHSNLEIMICWPMSCFSCIHSTHALLKPLELCYIFRR